MDKAEDIMSDDVFRLMPTASLNLLEVTAESLHLRHIPVVDDKDRPIGMVSIRDVVKYLTSDGATLFAPVKAVMTEGVECALRTTPVTEIAQIMREKNISAVPIVEKEKIVGIVTERDFLKLV